jgi:hypothetical protein
VIVHDHVLHERDPAILALLLKPGEAAPVRLQAGDDIVQPIAVHVVDSHDTAPGWERLQRPNACG